MDKEVVLIDGVCVLCNRLAHFIIKRDKAKKFLFIPFQTRSGKKYLEEYRISTENPDFLIVISGKDYFVRSTAVLKIFRKMPGFWPVFYPLIFIPRVIRDYFYKLIARNRYNWFGKYPSCPIPAGELKEHILVD
ncbi:MAG: DUF393 domain-containing protein [Bacteroidetes bacterium]|nr:DUF393 domain-containing protein [Bacteroidota bacterium]